MQYRRGLSVHHPAIYTLQFLGQFKVVPNRRARLQQSAKLFWDCNEHQCGTLGASLCCSLPLPLDDVACFFTHYRHNLAN